MINLFPHKIANVSLQKDNFSGEITKFHIFSMHEFDLPCCPLVPPFLPTVDKMNIMMGSYGPKTEPHEFKTQPQEAPEGMLLRGSYVVKSKFIDDDKKEYAAWTWNFSIKKDWED